MRPFVLCYVVAAATIVCCRPLFCADAQGDDMGYLCGPPVFVTSYPDFPLTGLGIEVPANGVTIPAGDISSMTSDGFRKDGINVQPALRVNLNTLRIGALRGMGDGWAVGITIPWRRNKEQGNIGGLPAYGVGEGLGDIAVVGKKVLWEDECDCNKVVVSAGLEFPTGKDDATFGQNNASTRGYYKGPIPRMPLGWQAGSGSLDAYLALAAGRRCGRMTYVGLLAAKLHTPADQDVKIGNILSASAAGTYGVTRNVAAALSVDLRTQADDSYPNAPPPGVGGPLLEGTTIHGTTLFLTPSVRVRFGNRLTFGVAVRFPVVKPDSGMVPRLDFGFIFAPGL